MQVSGILENIDVARTLLDMRHRSKWTAEKIQDFQLERLRFILTAANNRFEGYRELIKQAGINPEKIRDISELSNFPPINKDTYRQIVKDAVAQEGDAISKKYHRDQTSGSTGKPLTIWRTRNERAYLKAKLLWILTSNSFRASDILFWPVTPDRATSRDSQLQRLGVFRRVSPSYLDPPETLCAVYEKARPSAVMSNRSVLALMASHFEKQGISPHQPKLCITLGESSDSTTDSLLQRVFGPGQMDYYGAAECGLIAHKAPGEDYFRVSDTSILQMDSNVGNASNQITANGRVLVTNLQISSFPIIRYDLGDIATLDHLNGRQVIRELRGRDDDLLLMPDGSKRGWYYFKPAMKTPNDSVAQYRVIQKSRKDTTIQLILRPGIQRNSTLETLEQQLRSMVSEDMNWDLEVVHSMQPDSNGKIRAVTNNCIDE